MQFSKHMSSGLLMLCESYQQNWNPAMTLDEALVLEQQQRSRTIWTNLKMVIEESMS